MLFPLQSADLEKSQRYFSNQCLQKFYGCVNIWVIICTYCIKIAFIKNFTIFWYSAFSCLYLYCFQVRDLPEIMRRTINSATLSAWSLLFPLHHQIGLMRFFISQLIEYLAMLGMQISQKLSENPTPPPKKYVHSFLRGGPNRKGIKRCSSSSSCTEKISLMHFNNFEIVWGQICHISNSSIYQWLRSFNCCVTRLLSCVTRHPSSRQRNSVSSV